MAQDTGNKPREPEGVARNTAMEQSREAEEARVADEQAAQARQDERATDDRNQRALQGDKAAQKEQKAEQDASERVRKAAASSLNVVRLTDGFHLLTDKGDRAGGPYGSREEAEGERTTRERAEFLRDLQKKLGKDVSVSERPDGTIGAAVQRNGQRQEHVYDGDWTLGEAASSLSKRVKAA